MQQITKSLNKILIVCLLLISLTVNQNICQNCMDINSQNFTCNNLGCDGFMLTPTQNNQLNTNTINCIGGSSCYYSSNSVVYSNSYYYYLFCNYTFPGCTSCSNDKTCSNCQNGYFPQVYNPTLELISCQPCQDYIGGCQICYSQNVCIQCSSEYLNVFGLCYSQHGNIIGGTSKPWNKNGSTPTQIITGVQLLLICVVLMYGIVKICCGNDKNSNNRQEGDVNYDRQIMFVNNTEYKSGQVYNKDIRQNANINNNESQIRNEQQRMRKQQGYNIEEGVIRQVKV